MPHEGNSCISHCVAQHNTFNTAFSGITLSRVWEIFYEEREINVARNRMIFVASCFWYILCSAFATGSKARLVVGLSLLLACCLCSCAGVVVLVGYLSWWVGWHRNVGWRQERQVSKFKTALLIRAIRSSVESSWSAASSIADELPREVRAVMSHQLLFRLCPVSAMTSNQLLWCQFRVVYKLNSFVLLFKNGRMSTIVCIGARTCSCVWRYTWRIWGCTCTWRIWGRLRRGLVVGLEKTCGE